MYFIKNKEYSKMQDTLEKSCWALEFIKYLNNYLSEETILQGKVREQLQKPK
jgi:hypothetical protein